MIGRFIQHQEVGSSHAHFGQRHARFLTSREGRHHLHGQITRNAKTAQHSPILLDGFSRVGILKQFHTVDAHVQLVHVMLSKVTKAETSMGMYQTTGRLQVSGDDLEEGGLTGTVLADLRNFG